MFYRVTRYQFSPGREGDIAAWADTKTEQIRQIDGLIAVDVFNADAGEGVIVAAYESQAHYEAAAALIGAALGELAEFLTGPPMTVDGVPFWTTRAEEASAV